MKKNTIYTNGYTIQGWEVIGRTPVNKNHTIFTLASPEYENERGIFRESIKVRDNVITSLEKGIDKISKVRDRSLANWYDNNKDTFDIICVKANPDFIRSIKEEYNLW